jgi:hypothetical protein
MRGRITWRTAGGHLVSGPSVLGGPKAVGPLGGLSFMPFSQEERDRIAAALNERHQDLNTCPVCGVSDWVIGTHYVALVLQDDPVHLKLTGTIYPLVPLVCRNCGNTQLINANVLGLRDLYDVDESEVAEEGLSDLPDGPDGAAESAEG